MKKEELVKQLEAAKALSSQVDIDKVIELIKQIETGGLTEELAEEIADQIERSLDNNSLNDLVDCDSAEFEINYDNRVELIAADVNVSGIMEHIVAVMDDFVSEAEDLQVEAYNENFGTFLSRLENESGLDQ
jgi:hypothetical protein